MRLKTVSGFSPVLGPYGGMILILFIIGNFDNKKGIDNKHLNF